MDLLDDCQHIYFGTKATISSTLFLDVSFTISNITEIAQVVFQVLPTEPGREVLDSDFPLGFRCGPELHEAATRRTASPSPTHFRVTTAASITREAAPSLVYVVHTFRVLHCDTFSIKILSIEVINCIVSISNIVKVHKRESRLHHDVGDPAVFAKEVPQLSLAGTAMSNV